MRRDLSAQCLGDDVSDHLGSLDKAGIGNVRVTCGCPVPSVYLDLYSKVSDGH